jgi:type VI secretion system protein ImpL
MEAAAIPVAELPTADALTRLDGLRGVGARLAAYDHGERPLRLRWGLYRGGELRTEVRRLYFDRFERMLWGGARSDLVASLAVLPGTPRETADYGRAYDALKAYLVTTSHPEESTPEFLTPVILDHWRLAPGMDPERGELAHRQFDYYAAELPDGNPYAAEPNTALVQRTRIYLQSFSGVDAFYQALLSEAGRAGKPVEFNRMYPGTEAVVRNAYTVPGAFTAEGWEQVQSMLADVDRLFAREDWVVGERSVSPAERAQLAQQLRQRYTADYVAHWSDFLRAASVVGFDGAADAAKKLTALGGNESPLLRMFALASHHTAVDSLAVAPAFQPVQAVVPPQASESFVTDANSQYLAALVGLQTAMDQVAQAAGPDRIAALGQAAAGARNVEAQVRTLAQGFHVDHGASETGTIVQRLMLTPVGGAEALVKGIPLAEANDKGRQFCAPFRQLAAAYPFAPGATREATVEDVNAALQPGASALWSFYQDALTPMIAQQGSRYAARIGAEPPPNPEFVAFFNRAAQISHALYPANATAPRVDFAFALQTSDAMPEATFALDGQTQTFTRTMVAARPFSWDGSQSRAARITARVGGQSVTVAEAAGPWAVFRLLQRAEWQPSGNGQYLLRWPVVGGGTLNGTLTFAGGAPVFSPRYLQGLDCVSRIVR